MCAFFNPLNPLKVNNKFITSPEALKAEINGRVFSGDGGNLIMSKNAEERKLISKIQFFII